MAIDFDITDLRESILGTDTRPFRLLEDPDKVDEAVSWESFHETYWPDYWPSTDFGYAYIMAAKGEMQYSYGTAAIHPMLVRALCCLPPAASSVI